MKNGICVAVMMVGLLISSFGQDCSKIIADLKKGTINGLTPLTSQDEVKKKLPCFTGSDAEGSKNNCGGGVFFASNHFFFYTGDDYINIRNGFTGELSIPVFAKNEEELMKAFGNSAGFIVDDEDKYLFFSTSYGCICIKLEEGKKAQEIFMYAKPAEEVDLCI